MVESEPLACQGHAVSERIRDRESLRQRVDRESLPHRVTAHSTRYQRDGVGRREKGELVTSKRVQGSEVLASQALGSWLTRVCRQSCLKRVCRETVVEGDAEQFRHQERLPTQDSRERSREDRRERSTHDRRERSDSPPGATANTNEQSEQVRRQSSSLYKQVRRQSSSPSNSGARACYATRRQSMVGD